MLEGLGMKKVGVVYGLLEYLTAIWYILWLYGHLVILWQIWYIFHSFGILCEENSGSSVTAVQQVSFRFI
jgi:hypothetical protein